MRHSKVHASQALHGGCHLEGGHRDEVDGPSCGADGQHRRDDRAAAVPRTIACIVDPTAPSHGPLTFGNNAHAQQAWIQTTGYLAAADGDCQPPAHSFIMETGLHSLQSLPRAVGQTEPPEPAGHTRHSPGSKGERKQAETHPAARASTCTARRGRWARAHPALTWTAPGCRRRPGPASRSWSRTPRPASGAPSGRGRALQRAAAAIVPLRVPLTYQDGNWFWSHTTQDDPGMHMHAPAGKPFVQRMVAMQESKPAHPGGGCRRASARDTAARAAAPAASSTPPCPARPGRAPACVIYFL